MELKDILLLIDPAAPNAACLALAAGLARAHGATVRGLCLYETPPPSLAEGYALGGAAVASVIRHEADAVAHLLAPAHRAFLKAMAQTGLPPVWEPQPDFWVEQALARTATADLTIVGRSPADPDRWREVLEDLALHGGAPVLVVPEGRPPRPSFQRAVIAWNGSREAKRALDDALLFLKGCPGVDLVVVEGRHGPPGSDLPGLVGHLQRHGVAANVIRLSRDDEPVADVLRRHCEHVGADLLVLGAYSHSRAGEQVFGGVTRSLLRNPAVTTFVSH
ncbi:MAG TPA: universal stress protein [Phenylobacterium sp.]|jgi:nucleotide-binding universal stress UspA family protein